MKSSGRLLIPLFIILAWFPITEMSAGPENVSASPAARKEWRYTMNAGVRLLLFWIGRDNVGSGRIVWIDGPGDTRELELLIGSDPRRAPRQINRWGYIAERVSGSLAELTGLMTQSDEQSIEQASANTDRSGTGHVYKAIRCRVFSGEAQSFTVPMHFPEDYTYRDVTTVLNRVPQKGGTFRRLQVPSGTDPGFLFALRGMINESVEKFRFSGKPVRLNHRRYIYNAALYELAMQSTKILHDEPVNGRRHARLIESRFEARNTTSGEVTKFIIAYGADEPLAGAPVRIEYRPRWWFRAELLLEE